MLFLEFGQSPVLPASIQVSNEIKIHHMLVVFTKHVLKLCPAFGGRESVSQKKRLRLDNPKHSQPTLQWPDLAVDLFSRWLLSWETHTELV